MNGTPLLRGIEFTHAPAQAGERMAETAWRNKPLNAPEVVFCRIAGVFGFSTMRKQRNDETGMAEL